MKRRLLFIGLLVALVMTVVGAACSKAAPPASTTTTAGAKAHAPVTLEFLTMMNGTRPYAEAIAIADVLNRQHPWLKGTTLETKGLEEAIIIGGDYPAERRKNAVMGRSWYFTALNAIDGGSPFTKKYPGLRYLASYGTGVASFITYDDNIKKPADLIGKKVGTWNSSDNVAIAQAILGGWGIKDKVTLEQMPPSKFKDALKTGLISAVHVNFSLPKVGSWGAPSYVQEIATAGKWHTIPITAADVAKIAKETPRIPFEAMAIPANAIGQNFPSEEAKAALVLSAYFVFDTAENDVMYEFLKTMDDYNDQLTKTVPGLWVKSEGSMLAKGIVKDKSIVHPGALKYYQEKNLKFWE